MGFAVEDGVDKFFTRIYDYPYLAHSYLSDDTNTCEEEHIEDGVLTLRDDGSSGRLTAYRLEVQELDMAWVAYTLPPMMAQVVTSGCLSGAVNFRKESEQKH